MFTLFFEENPLKITWTAKYIIALYNFLSVESEFRFKAIIIYLDIQKYVPTNLLLRAAECLRKIQQMKTNGKLSLSIDASGISSNKMHHMNDLGLILYRVYDYNYTLINSPNLPSGIQYYISNECKISLIFVHVQRLKCNTYTDEDETQIMLQLPIPNRIHYNYTQFIDDDIPKPNLIELRIADGNFNIYLRQYSFITREKQVKSLYIEKMRNDLNEFTFYITYKLARSIFLQK